MRANLITILCSVGLITSVVTLVLDDLGYFNLKSRDFLISLSGASATTLGIRKKIDPPKQSND